MSFHNTDNTSRNRKREKPVFKSDHDVLLHILVAHKARFVKEQISKGGAKFEGIKQVPALCSFPG